MNESPEVAENAEQRVGDMLRRGIERRAVKDLEAGEPWQKRKAEKTLSDIDSVHAAALPKWLNRLLADPRNTTRDFKLLRAHRRGLLHYDRPVGWGYPNNWKEVASRIRQLDGYRCVVCAADDCTIDVHHIVYVSNFGTHQKTNLISLCRPCHESEHKRMFDFGESETDHAVQTDSVLSSSQPMPHDATITASIPEVPETIQPLPQKPTFQQEQIPHSPSNKQPAPVPIPVPIPVPVPAPAAFQLPPPLRSLPSKVDSVSIEANPKVCGNCRTLVLPKRRFFLFRYCPNCRVRM